MIKIYQREIGERISIRRHDKHLNVLCADARAGEESGGGILVDKIFACETGEMLEKLSEVEYEMREDSYHDCG